MLWISLIIAMITAVLVELASFFMRVKNYPLIFTVQFFVVTAVTYGVAYYFQGSNVGMKNVLATCAGMSLVIVGINIGIHHFFGSWYDRRPGPGMKRG